MNTAIQPVGSDIGKREDESLTNTGEITGDSSVATPEETEDRKEAFIPFNDAVTLYDNEMKLNIDNYMVYARRLNGVIRIARFVSHQLACLSTLGGANHLCDKPKEALKIAIRQEFIGLAIGSTSIAIRARVYQAVNYGLMNKANKSKKIFIECEDNALVQGWSSLIDFVHANKIWLRNELKYKKLKNGELNST